MKAAAAYGFKVFLVGISYMTLGCLMYGWFFLVSFQMPVFWALSPFHGIAGTVMLFSPLFYVAYLIGKQGHQP